MKLLWKPMPLNEAVLRKSPGGNPSKRTTLTAQACDRSIPTASQKNRSLGVQHTNPDFQ